MKIVIKIDKKLGYTERAKTIILSTIMENLNGQKLHTKKNLKKYNIINQRGNIVARVKIK